HLSAVEAVAAVHLLRPGLETAGVGAVIGLGEAEAADPFAGGQLRQVLLLLRLRAVGVDRVHHQAGLDAHRRAIGAVDPLDLTRDHAVHDMAAAGAAIALETDAEEAVATHRLVDLA